MKNITFKIAFFFFQITAQHCIAQNNSSLTFNLITNNNGDPLGKITAITQDKYGYMWFAGQDAQCLYRYDGYRITSFRHDSLNANSLGGTNLETVFADSFGIIWIGFYGSGLDRFNPVTHQFRHFRFSANNAHSLSNDSVTQVLRDKKGRVWVGTQNGLNLLNESNGQFKRYVKTKGDSTSLSSNVIRSVYEDHEGTLWIGTGFPFDQNDPGDGGLNRMESNGAFKQFLHDQKNPHSLLNNKVRSIFEDSHGNFWIGTGENGVHIMNRKNGSFERFLYDPKAPYKLSGPQYNPNLWFEHITFITEDGSGTIWMGTYASGINCYDPKTKKITHFLADNSFSDRSGWCAFTSTDGVLWLSTQEPNLFRINPFQTTVTNTHTDNPVTSFYQDSNKLLWTGTFEKGLFEFDQNKNFLRKYGSANIHCIFYNQENKLWLGTGSGVTIFDKHINSLTPSKISYETFCILKDKEGCKWLATLSGLFKLNQKDSIIERYTPVPHDSNSISSARVISLLQDKRGFIWSGTVSNGINRLNPATGRFTHYLNELTARCIYQTSDEKILVGTSKGLYKYNYASNTFSLVFDAQNDASLHGVLNITEDNLKNLWVSTDLTVVNFNPEKNQVFTYGRQYGIIPNTLRTGMYKTSNGEILIGNNKGFFTFVPHELSSSDKPSTILVTDFYVNDSLVINGDKSVLSKPVEETGKIELKHDQNHLSFNFAVIDYRAPYDNKIFTMLEGFDNVWRRASNENNADYFNVPPGKYRFRIKAFNSDGTMNEKTLLVIIDLPWWKTSLAYVCYAICFIFFVLVANRIIKNRIVEKEKIKNREKELVHARQIEKAYNDLKSTQAQLIQSEKMASLGELTAGIAHEIQNPLNFVNNFSEVNKELLVELKEEAEKGNMDEVKAIATDVIDNEEKILHHGKRADAIVKGMLQHSRQTSGTKEPTDINALADEYLRLAYHGLRAKDKSFNATLKTDYDQNIGNINIIPQDMGRVILNLITNAFYAVDEKQKSGIENYEPTVTVATKRLANKIEVRVSDNGGGIPPNAIDKIFQPFFTTKPTGQGTGLGLSLAYDIVKAHGGEIQVAPEEGGGTAFSFYLPITK